MNRDCLNNIKQLINDVRDIQERSSEAERKLIKLLGEIEKEIERAEDEVGLVSAAAEVGHWQKKTNDNAMQVLADRNAELMERLKTTIERCAQAADAIEQNKYGEGIIAARIRALKDKP